MGSFCKNALEDSRPFEHLEGRLQRNGLAAGRLLSSQLNLPKIVARVPARIAFFRMVSFIVAGRRELSKAPGAFSVTFFEICLGGARKSKIVDEMGTGAGLNYKERKEIFDRIYRMARMGMGVPARDG